MKNTFIIVGALPSLFFCALLLRNPFSEAAVLRFLRSPIIDGAVFFAASAAFLRKVLSLGEADFGNFRPLIFCLFAFIAMAMLVRNYGFLSVRGQCVLQLLWANELLKCGLGHYSPIWILAKLFAYATIILALYLTIYPYRMRDWLLRRCRR
ncbi:MAG: hypothetical protein LBI39_02910 [Puniceicoccales bacterium]|jgi:hypothetical protein|nr:hypothetical protein [Puniceicoccales bacterium]